MIVILVRLTTKNEQSDIKILFSNDLRLIYVYKVKKYIYI